jgi:hypothetical protein
MKVPGIGLVSRVPVPAVVRSAAAPLVRAVTPYAVEVRDRLNDLLDQTIAEIVGRVDLDATVQRLDIDAVLDRVDLTEIVVKRVDLDVLLREVFARITEEELSALMTKVDVNAIAGSLDIEAILDRMDLTTTVLQRVDLIKVVDAVLDQMDLIALANQVIEGVDLPDIIRDSTGTMASETVNGVRMQGIGADQAVGRVVDRLLLRHARAAGTPRS